MFHRIVVGNDGSEHARQALEVALDIAQRYGAELHVAAVAQVPDYAGSVDEVDEAIRQAKVYYQPAFDEAQALARSKGVSAQTHLLKGHAAQGLIELARQVHADLIVVGSRGLSTFQRFLLGSVSEAVVHHAPCPVLVVRRKHR